MRMRGKVLFLLLLGLLLSCSPLPGELRVEGVRRELGFSAVRGSPTSYLGQRVMWGGRILHCANERERTILEVLELPLDGSGRPVEGDRSGGRFLVHWEGFHDCAIYEPGRHVTVIGEVKDEKEARVGEMPYRYVVLSASKVHLWPREKETVEVYHHLEPWPCPWWRCWCRP